MTRAYIVNANEFCQELGSHPLCYDAANVMRKYDYRNSISFLLKLGLLVKIRSPVRLTLSQL